MKKIFLILCTFCICTVVFANPPEWLNNYQQEDETYYYGTGYGDTYEEAVQEVLNEFAEPLSLYLGLDSYEIDTAGTDVDPYEYKNIVAAVLPEALAEYVEILDTYDPQEDDNPDGVYIMKPHVYAALLKSDRNNLYYEAFDLMAMMVQEAVEEQLAQKSGSADADAEAGNEDSTEQEPPAWINEPPSADDTYFYVTGSANTPRIAMANQMAQADAREQAAYYINSDIEVLVRTNLKNKVHNNDIEDYVYEVTMKATANAEINGVTIIDSYFADDGTFFVLAAVPVENLEQPLDYSYELVNEILSNSR